MSNTDVFVVKGKLIKISDGTIFCQKMKFHQNQNVFLRGVNLTDIYNQGAFLFCFGKVKSLFLCLFGFFTQNVDILQQDLICYIALMLSKQNFKLYQYGRVQNWIFLDCHFMRNLKFFFGSDSMEKHARMSVSHMTQVLFFTQFQL